jgi:hypothetical protein
VSSLEERQIELGEALHARSAYIPISDSFCFVASRNVRAETLAPDLPVGNRSKRLRFKATISALV